MAITDPNWIEFIVKESRLFNIYGLCRDWVGPDATSIGSGSGFD
jgi:hypothetical protein